MTLSKLTGIRALAKLRDERVAFEAREAKARREAAIELGDIVLAAGADVLPLADLKNALVAAVAAHATKPASPRLTRSSAASGDASQLREDHGDQT